MIKIERKALEQSAIVITIFIAVITCSLPKNQSLENKILEICINCSTTNCLVDLKEITPFKWDSLFIFNEYDDPETISTVTSIKYKGSSVPDSKYRMIFTCSNSIVYEEDYGGKSKINHVYVFMPIDTTSYSKTFKAFTKSLYSISSKQAKFFIKKPSLSNSILQNSYYLSPVIDTGRKALIPG